jgi:hypothetical protein
VSPSFFYDVFYKRITWNIDLRAIVETFTW